MSPELNQIEVAVPTPLKLRGSCDACSLSKVRCDKAKPICSRCARRKITCQYVATKRVGRKQNSTRKNSISSSANKSKSNSVDMSQTITAITQTPSQVLPPADMGMSLSTDMDVDLFMSNADSFDYSVFSSMTSPNTNSLVQTPSPQTSSSTATTSSLPVWDLFSNLFPLDPALSTDLDGASVQGANSVPALYDDFQDLFTATGVDTSSKANPGTNHALQGTDPLFPDNDFAGLEATTFTEQLTTPQQHVVQSEHASPPRVGLGLTAESSTSPTCGPCIIDALALMRQLFPSRPLELFARSSQESETPTPSPTFDNIISQNEAVTDACISMLKCACSEEDGYLLAVISLIVFKVLAWYAAAVHLKSDTGATAAESTNRVYDDGIGAVDDDDFDAARMAGQLLLGKMHRVQHLVNQLSAKLKAKAAGRRSGGSSVIPSVASSAGSVAGSEGGIGTHRADFTGCLPVSGIMLEQLEVDLRKRLRGLSLEIIGVLKRD